ncbi:phage tail protein [Klebsiella oxytoca]|uniref:phage tail-collar fiber domain-containing protein n=1 Tax=Klebsiella oxytoca TaxID=571 RepID=UPI00255101D1|nr:phage tail protein [Klebsiella oxytoca]MDK8001123.1 phage tail protein [Klebsiella oxytoca]MDK8044144.1 phage tail protein [Klebsiella oxytoca]HEJ9370921.1 phage tail protein [Klebsiella oxytoca]
MSQSVITNAFSPWLAARLAENKPARPDRMVFALIEGQDENAEINPDEQLPAKGLITHTADIVHFGTLNERAFVCSVVLDTTVGNWHYNWIGLVDSESDTLLMIVHTAEQQKIKTAAGIQGNTLSRNLMMEFSGAAAASQITVTAETWQIDYSARLRSMDESRRLACVDYYGPAAFDGDGFAVSVAGGVATVAPGLGYVGGLRVLLAQATTVLAANTTVWVDAVWSGTTVGTWSHTFTIRTGASLEDYVDTAGYQHYVARIATIAGGVVTDRRLPFPLQRIEQELNDLDVYDKSEADERFLQAKNNLSDLEDKAKARENLGFNIPDGPVFRAIIDAVFWVGRSVISDSDPGTRYTWQTWRDLSADYDGRVLRISDAAMKTGGSNSVKVEGDNLPPHWHRSGDRSPGTVWDPNTTHGTDNQKSGPLALTEGTYIDADGRTESTNKPLDVTNEYVTVRVWRRTA